jgi:Ca2+-binding EF-hand superfamily protein
LLFTINDTDKSGFLTSTEIAALMNQMKSIAMGLGRSVDDADAIIAILLKKLDKNGDGKISLEEFVTQGANSQTLFILMGVNY